MSTGFGIDIGGSGIKGAPVDLTSGEFSAARLRIPTPQPATPSAVAVTVAEPVATALARPLPSTVTLAGAVLDQLTGIPASTEPDPSRTVAVSCRVRPSAPKATVPGSTDTVAPRTPR